jgi:predicted Zn-dependent peptidase
MTKGFKKIVLDNGLRIILAPQPQTLATTVLVLTETGSLYETKEINGISHFLEHLCFKGTKNRPRSLDISSELDGLGAEYNAFTLYEGTGYFAKAQNKHLYKILDLIGDLYLNPVFDPQEIGKERGVIIEEINMYRDLPNRRVQELFLRLLYGDQPAGWPITGTRTNIKKLQRNEILRYRDGHYLGNTTLIVVVGVFEEGKLIDEIKKVFQRIKTGQELPKPVTKESQEKPAVLLKSKNTDQTHLVLGVRAYNLFDPKRYPLELLAHLLGGGMSSRLFQKIREILGAAYYVYASADLFSSHGYLAVAAGVDNLKIETVISAVLEDFLKLKNETVPVAELRKAKDHLLGRLFLSLEGSDEWAGFYGGQEIIEQRIKTPEEIVKEIENVNAGQIKAVAQDIFQNSKLNLALIGPFEEPARFEKILSLD